jgi:hypothetical protein
MRGFLFYSIYLNFAFSSEIFFVVKHVFLLKMTNNTKK